MGEFVSTIMVPFYDCVDFCTYLNLHHGLLCVNLCYLSFAVVFGGSLLYPMMGIGFEKENQLQGISPVTDFCVFSSVECCAFRFLCSALKETGDERPLWES